jgi:methionyl-tRNA synthetase
MLATITAKEQQLINFSHYVNTHPWVAVLLAVLAVWTIIWKGLALWRAARTGRKDWYIVMLIVNTVGILEIVYLYFFSNKQDSQQ